MRWSWQKARPVEPRPMVSTRVMELETAKEILAEVFHARSGEVEEMIKSWLEERRRPEEREEGLWPATFCPGGVDAGRRFESRRRGVKEVSCS